MRTFKTNCLCPKCRHSLRTSDLPDYSFVCLECDENFFGIEVKEVCGDYVEISIFAAEKDFTRSESALQKLAEKTGADFLGYDNISEYIDFGWEKMPSSKQIAETVAGLEEILF